MSEKNRYTMLGFLLVLTFFIINAGFCQENKQGGNLNTPEGEIIRIFKSGDYNLTIELAEKYLEKNPNNVDILNVLGNAYFLKGDASSAERVIKKALEIDPNNSISKQLQEQLLLEQEIKQSGNLNE